MLYLFVKYFIIKKRRGHFKLLASVIKYFRFYIQ